jgi:hypothetical protein
VYITLAVVVEHVFHLVLLEQVVPVEVEMVALLLLVTDL